MEEHGDEQNDDERGEGSGEGGGDGAPRLLEFIADEYADVDGEHARATLGYGDKVEKLFLGKPLVAVYHLVLYNRYHGIATTEGD